MGTIVVLRMEIDTMKTTMHTTKRVPKKDTSAPPLQIKTNTVTNGALLLDIHHTITNPLHTNTALPEGNNLEVLFLPNTHLLPEIVNDRAEEIAIVLHKYSNKFERSSSKFTKTWMTIATMGWNVRTTAAVTHPIDETTVIHHMMIESACTQTNIARNTFTIVRLLMAADTDLSMECQIACIEREMRMDTLEDDRMTNLCSDHHTEGHE